MLREVKNDRFHYFVDNEGRYQGEYKDWDGNGQMTRHCFYVDDRRHGEFKRCYSNGTIWFHDFYVDGKVYRDLIKEPVTDEEKFLITLETGGKWLC
jgi:antitoxin component YwqK of YwqJK toxin-antitoxin module